jgi:beta-glucanase (GH16 family)
MEMKRKIISTILAAALCINSVGFFDEHKQVYADTVGEIIPTGTYTLPVNDPYDRTGSGWDLVWNDEFNGTSLNRAFWTADDNGYGGWNHELQYYRDFEYGDGSKYSGRYSNYNFRVNNGSLKIVARRITSTGTGLDYDGNEVNNKTFNYTSARLQTADKVAIKYGKLEARIMMDTFAGAWPAFWVYGNERAIPHKGEIDILEAVNTDKIVYGTAHWAVNNPNADNEYKVDYMHSGGNTGSLLAGGLDFSQYHVYGIEWDADRIIWYLDDEVFWTTQITSENMDDLRQAQYFLLNYAVGGEMTGITEYNGNAGSVDMGQSATMTVDWVRAYKKSATADKTLFVEKNVLEDYIGNWIPNGYVNPDYWAGSQGTLIQGANPYDGFEVDITNYGNYPGENYTMQTWLPDISLEGGKPYTIEFDIESDHDKTVTFQIEQYDNVTGEAVTHWLDGRTLVLDGGESQHVSLNLYLPSNFDDTLHLNYMFGDHGESGLVTPNTLTVSNVKILTNTSVPVPSEGYEFYSEVGKTVVLPLDKEIDSTLVYGTMPAASDNGSTIVNQTAVGNRTGNITYTGVTSGDDTFEVSIHERGDATNSATVPVTVHNYEVNPSYYVLDYGLRTDLLTNAYDNGLLEPNVLEITGVDTQYRFHGLTASLPGALSYQPGSTYLSTLSMTQGNASVQVSGVTTPSFLGSQIASSKVFFEPKKFMDDVEDFYYGIQVTKSSDINFAEKTAKNSTPIMNAKVTVMPANIVYYEDNFAQSGTGANGSNGIIYSTERTSGSDVNGEQTNSLTEQYGHDPAYEGASTDSQGITHIMNEGDTAIFAFRGTGFDISSRTTDATGIMQATVYDASKVTIENGAVKIKPGMGFTSIVKTILVNTYYQNGNLYQVPVITFRSGLNTAGDYVVKLSSGGSGKTVYIDGIRIYNPITGNNSVNAKYGTIGENGATVEEAKSLILGTTDYGTNYGAISNEESLITILGTPKVSLVDFSNNTMSVGKSVVEAFSSYTESGGVPSTLSDLITYAASGPNHELYLGDDYGIAFTADKRSSTNATLQIALKKVGGTGSIVVKYMKSDDSWGTLATVSSYTQNYYHLDNITNEMPTDATTGKPQVILKVEANADAILSVTYLKHSNYDIDVLSEGINNDIQQKPITITGQNISGGFNHKKQEFGPYMLGTITVNTTSDVYDIKVFNGGVEMPTVKNYTETGSGYEWTLKFKTETTVKLEDLEVFSYEFR